LPEKQRSNLGKKVNLKRRYRKAGKGGLPFAPREGREKKDTKRMALLAGEKKKGAPGGGKKRMSVLLEKKKPDLEKEFRQFFRRTGNPRPEKGGSAKGGGVH